MALDFWGIRRSISSIKECRAAVRDLKSKIESRRKDSAKSKGAIRKFEKKLKEKRGLCRRELLSLGAKTGALTVVVGAVGYKTVSCLIDMSKLVSPRTFGHTGNYEAYEKTIAGLMDRPLDEAKISQAVEQIKKLNEGADQKFTRLIIALLLLRLETFEHRGNLPRDFSARLLPVVLSGKIKIKTGEGGETYGLDGIPGRYSCKSRDLNLPLRTTIGRHADVIHELYHVYQHQVLKLRSESAAAKEVPAYLAGMSYHILEMGNTPASVGIDALMQKTYRPGEMDFMNFYLKDLLAYLNQKDPGIKKRMLRDLSDNYAANYCLVSLKGVSFKRVLGNYGSLAVGAWRGKGMKTSFETFLNGLRFYSDLGKSWPIRLHLRREDGITLDFSADIPDQLFERVLKMFVLTDHFVDQGDILRAAEVRRRLVKFSRSELYPHLERLIRHYDQRPLDYCD